jgi:hypothetical protein
MSAFPFSKACQLSTDLDDDATEKLVAKFLPDQPALSLRDTDRLWAFLEKDLVPNDLERIASRLWIMTTPSSANINPLHRQQVKGRDIVITEEPRLHLLWIHNRIFVKPLPRYLISFGFWNLFLRIDACKLSCERDNVRKAALGFIRTYRHLIQSESDFFIAQRIKLIPEGIDWPAFARFVFELEKIEDFDTSERYTYGEIRLTRLNFYAPFLLGKFYYEQVHGQYADYFGRLYGPILFVFAILSTALNSMQVELATDELVAPHWKAMWPIFRGFSALCLVGVISVCVWFIVLWFWIFLDEWIWTLKQRRKRERSCRERRV